MKAYYGQALKQAVYKLSWILIIILRTRHYYHSHFTDEEIKQDHFSGPNSRLCPNIQSKSCENSLKPTQTGEVIRGH